MAKKKADAKKPEAKKSQEEKKGTRPLAGAGDMGTVIERLKALKEEVESGSWWAATQSIQAIVAEVRLGMSGGDEAASFSLDEDDENVAVCLNACIKECEDHDEGKSFKKADAPRPRGGIWDNLLPMLMPVIQAILQKWLSKEVSQEDGEKSQEENGDKAE